MDQFYCLSFGYPSIIVKKTKDALDALAVKAARGDATAKQQLSISSRYIINERKNKSLVITIDNPASLNACDEEMISSLHHSFQSVGRDQNTDLVVLRGSIKGLFCSGIDLKSFVNDVQEPYNSKQRFDLGTDICFRSLYLFSELKVPTVSILDGVTAGYGAGLAYASKFRIATENTFFYMPEVTVGHFCDAATSYALSRLEGHFGKYMALCSKRFRADDELFKLSRIATHFVPSERLNALVKSLSCLSSPTAHTVNEEINKFSTEFPIKKRFDRSLFEDKYTVIRNCFKYDTVEEIVKALEEDGTEFAIKSRDQIVAGSPQAAKVTLELLCQARSLSFAECVVLERQMWHVDVLTHDFLEGCLSKMVDRKPQWYPKLLGDIDLEQDIRVRYMALAKTFEPLDLQPYY